MAVSTLVTGGASLQFPFTPSSLVFSGYSSKGYYNHASSLPAGDYVFSFVPSDPSAKIFVSAPNSNLLVSTDKFNTSIHTTTTENPIKITALGKLGYPTTYNNYGTPSSINNIFGYNNGNIWFATSNNYWAVVSTDGGATWSTYTANTSNPYGTYSTLYDGTGYWIGYYDAAYYSTNLTSWSTRAVGTGNLSAIQYLGYDGTTWVAGGQSAISSSTNGTSWTARWSTGNIYSGNYANGKHVLCSAYVSAYGGPVLIQSSNGTSWSTTSMSNVYGTSTNSNIQSIAYGNGTWVTIGYNYSTTPSTAVIAYSKDNASTFKVGYSNPTTGQTYSSFGNRITFFNGMFVTTLSATNSPNESVLLYSADGINWATSPSGAGGTSQIQGLTATNDGNRLVGVNGNMSPSAFVKMVDMPMQIFMYSVAGQTVLN